MTKSTITCPHCQTEIELTASKAKPKLKKLDPQRVVHGIGELIVGQELLKRIKPDGAGKTK